MECIMQYCVPTQCEAISICVSLYQTQRYCLRTNIYEKLLIIIFTTTEVKVENRLFPNTKRNLKGS